MADDSVDMAAASLMRFLEGLGLSEDHMRGIIALPPAIARVCGTMVVEALAEGGLSEEKVEEAVKRAAAIEKMSHRRCWACGHVDYYLAPVLPECACAKCGSADTRLVKK